MSTERYSRQLTAGSVIAAALLILFNSVNVGSAIRGFVSGGAWEAVPWLLILLAWLALLSHFLRKRRRPLP
jgi:hypothetical protein